MMNKARRHISKAIVVGLGLFYLTYLPVIFAAQPRADALAIPAKDVQRESRIILDEDIYWATSRDATDQILSRIKSAGFNVYVPCVWHGAGTYYSSAVPSKDKRIAQRIERGDDPLEYLLQKAHAIGIEVHPWFTVVRRETDNFKSFYDSGTPEDAFDVHKPAFRNFIVETMLDVVKRYPVDGVNLDYIRSMGTCTSDYCADDYKKFSGRSLVWDIPLSKLPVPTYSRIDQWNAYAVNDIVKRFATRAKQLRPKIIISVDTVPLANHIKLQGGDSRYWVEIGWVDAVFNMAYEKKIDEDAATKTYQLFPKGKMSMIFMTYDIPVSNVVPRNPSILSDYIYQTRLHWPGSGVGFYHYRQLTDAQIAELIANPFKAAAVPSWKNNR